VLGVNSAGSLHGKRGICDEARITERSKVIGYAIDARKRRFPDETPFVYQPHQASGERHVWNDEARAGILNYNLLDLSI
jgi:hypothetical protein